MPEISFVLKKKPITRKLYMKLHFPMVQHKRLLSYAGKRAKVLK